MKLLTLGNPKAMKSLGYGYLTGLLHLAPFTLSGRNVCPKASRGCRVACLNRSGRGAMEHAQKARVRKTLQYFNSPDEFKAMLFDDIARLKRQATRAGLLPAVRINGTSDIPKLAIEAANAFPDVQFYDYTKIKQSMFRLLPDNYHLTFSRSEQNEREVMEVLKAGFNAAVVFDVLPEKWNGYRVVNGDLSDLRFLDPKNVVVGLVPKGAHGKRDTSGFVVR
jgi:hypothetical protein